MPKAILKLVEVSIQSRAVSELYLNEDTVLPVIAYQSRYLGQPWLTFPPQLVELDLKPLVVCSLVEKSRLRCGNCELLLPLD